MTNTDLNKRLNEIFSMPINKNYKKAILEKLEKPDKKPKKK